MDRFSRGSCARLGQRFAACERGATAVEFAMIGGTVLTLMMGIMEISMAHTARNALEHAVFVGSRVGKTCYIDTEAELDREETIRAALKGKAGIWLDPDKVAITRKSYESYASVGAPEPFTDVNENGAHDEGEPFTDLNGDKRWSADRGGDNAGDAGSIVVYTVTYPWELVTPGMTKLIGGEDGAITVSARAVVKNEPC